VESLGSRSSRPSVAPVFLARQASDQRRAHPEFYYSNDPEKVAKQMVDSVPLRRLGTVEEVIQTVMFLLSDESSYITGTDINVSGGNVMGGSRG